jgi:hypothetical protein
MDSGSVSFNGERLAFTVFDFYFASIVAMQFHPGAGQRFHVRLSLEDCADVAAQCCEIREEYLRRVKCRGD